MAKVGDHVDTIHGKGTVLTGKRVFIHGTKDTIISFAGDKEIKDKKRRVIRGVIRTRLQVDECTISNFKKYMKAQKAVEKGEKTEKEKSIKRKPKEEIILLKPKPIKKKPKLTLPHVFEADDVF